MAVLVGKRAPSFKATAVIDSEFEEDFSLDRYLGKKHVIFYFYPADFTFVCPTEIIAFQDRLADFEAKGVAIVGCSTDTHFSHFAWLQTPRDNGGIQGVTYPLVADATKTIAAHRKAGDRILVISASGTHLVGPIAERLGIDEILGIELEVAHGVYSGHTVGTLTYREGKITRLLEWLDAEEGNLEGASFYSDSRNDLPLLLKVDYPHVVNPDPVLLEHAEKAGWPIHHWK